MKKYEIMYILNASLSDDDRKALIEKLHGFITENGGKITKVDEWGLRDLAYEINFQGKGYYVVINVEAENDAGINEFDRQCRIDKANVLRKMTIAL